MHCLEVFVLTLKAVGVCPSVGVLIKLLKRSFFNVSKLPLDSGKNPDTNSPSLSNLAL